MFTRLFKRLKKQEAETACMLPKLARYQLRHTSMCEKYSIFRSFSVSGQICGQTAFIEDFAREYSAEKVSVYKAVSSMFARHFKVLLFGAERLFARGGVPAACMLPNVARYQLRHTPKCEKYSIFRSFSVSGQICGQNILSVFF